MASSKPTWATEKDPVKLKKAYQEGYYVAEGLGEKLKGFMEA